MKSRDVFIAYDFEIKKGIINDFQYVKRHKPLEVQVSWANQPEGPRQGEIWRDLVRRDLEKAPRFIAYVDLPNANVGFEIGYALGHGEGKEAALARVGPTLPHWLELPPLNAFNIPQMSERDLLKQIKSGDWIESPRRPELGDEILFLCPHKAGFTFIDLKREKYPNWQELPDGGWNLKDMTERLKNIGTVVWVIVPHREGPEGRDGSENAAASVVAGFAQAAGMQLEVLKHAESRDIVDVGATAREFTGDEQFLAQLQRVAQDLERRLRKETPLPAAGQLEAPWRPNIAPPTELDVKEPRFIGREGLLAGVADALRGLACRRTGEPVEGEARVQAIWYHGFGGMGKSWFLYRAMLETRERVPSGKIAFIDWDDTVWRYPLLQPPQVWRHLLEAIAHRVAQQYGVEKLDAYWSAVQRTDKAESEASKLRERFNQRVNDLLQGKDTDVALRAALKERGLWAEGERRRGNLEALQDDVNLFHEIFLLWFEKGGASADDPDAVFRPDFLRTGALQECLRDVASHEAPLVVVLDTCEVLSLNLERSLRRLIAPLCDGRLPFLVLFGSRSMPDAGEPPGTKDLWRANIGGERWRAVPFDEDVQFTVQEIALSLRRMKRPVAQPDLIAERIHRLTEGVPLPTRWLMDAHEEGRDISVELQFLETPQTGASKGRGSLEERVVTLMADRFLYHLTDRPDRAEDLKDIILLSLLTEANHGVLSLLWDNVPERLRELSIRYSLLAMGDLHATVRSFLRRRWRYEDRPRVVVEVIAALVKASEALEAPGQPGEPAYMEAMALKLNILGWSLGSEGIHAFAPAIAVALAFNEHIEILVNLAVEIPLRNDKDRLHAALHEHAKHLQRWSWRVLPWGTDELLLTLSEEVKRGKWSPTETATFGFLQGLWLTSRREYLAALDPLLSALEVFQTGTIPRRSELERALFRIGPDLATTRKVNDAMRAYEAAIRVNQSDAAYNGLAVMLKEQKRYDEAEAQFRKASELAPAEPLYPRNLGGMYYERKLYQEAEEWYTKALAVDPNYAIVYNDRALMLKDQQRFAEAEAQFRKASELDPAEPLYPRNLGGMYRERKLYQEAEEWYTKALAVDPNYAIVYNDRALMLKDQQRFAEAEAQFRKASELAPAEPLYPRNLGGMYYERKLYQEAEEWYTKALAVDPNYAIVYNGRALMLKDQQRFAEAEAQFRKASELAPAEPLYPRNLGGMYYERKLYQEAEEWYTKALAVDPNYAIVYNDRALMLKDQQRFAEAEAQFRKASELDPAEPLYPRNLGDMYRERKLYQEAEEWYTKALAVDPNYATVYNGRALMLKDQQRFAEAEAQFRKASELAPAEPLYPRNLGGMYRERKLYQEAEEWYTKALAVDPNYATVYNDRALMLKDQQRFAEAEAQFRKASELAPAEPLYPRNLGDMYYERKLYQEAEEWYGNALAVDPAYVAASTGLALLWKDQKRYEDAERQLLKAIELSPDDPQSYYTIGDVYTDWNKIEKAVEFYRGAALHAPDDPYILNNAAWTLFENQRDLADAREFAFKAVALAPASAYLHTLASIELSLGDWVAARETTRTLIDSSEAVFLDNSRDDIVRLFRSFASAAQWGALATLLHHDEVAPHWKPWAEAVALMAETHSGDEVSIETQEILDLLRG